jgi:hypothetical protein
MAYARKIGFFDEGTFLYGEEPILGAIVEENNKIVIYCLCRKGGELLCPVK